MRYSTVLQIFRVACVAAVVCTGLAGCSGKTPDALVVSAKDYLAKKDVDAAIIELKNALQKNPDLPEARFLLGKALLETEDPRSAAIELRKAHELNYSPDLVVPLMARALLMQGQATKVIDEFEAATLSTPAATAELKSTVASALLTRSQRSKAEDALQAAFRAVPDDAGAMLVRARIQAGDGDLAAARATVDHVLAKAGENVDAWTLKGALLLRDGDQEKAIEAYRHALSVRKDSVLAHTAIISIFLSRNDLKSSKAQLDELRKLRPNQSQTRFLEAQWAFQSGDYKTAEQISQQLLKYGDTPHVLQLAAAVALQKGALLEAEQFLGKALFVGKGLDDAAGLMVTRQLLAQTYGKSGNPTKALETLAPLLEAKDPDARTLALAASAHLQNGEPEKAEELFGRAAKRNPGDVRSRTALALMHLYRDKSDAALAELESIANVDEGTTAEVALAAAKAQRKDYSGALETIGRIESKQPGKPLAANLRGRVLTLKGDIDGARKSFEEALSRDPANFVAADALAALDLTDNKLDLAEQRFDKLLSTDPDNGRALMAKAALQAHAGKNKQEVVALLARAMNARPREPAPRLMLINYHLQQGDFEQALSTAKDAAAALPSSLPVLGALARAQAATGDLDASIATFNKLATALPNSSEVRVARADVYAAAGKQEAALDSLKEALQLTPNFLPAQEKAIALEIEARHENEALAIAREVQKQRPKQAVGWLFEGDIRATAKNWTSATALYRTALQKEPTTVNAMKLHGGLLTAGKASRCRSARCPMDQVASERCDLLPIPRRTRARRGKAGRGRGPVPASQRVATGQSGLLNNLAWVTAKLGKPGALGIGPTRHEAAAQPADVHGYPGHGPGPEQQRPAPSDRDPTTGRRTYSRKTRRFGCLWPACT
jgi:putative PEP-CTERM system TPR-repeat lipoprotein